MKNLFVLFLFILAATPFSYSQQIIPFPDLSEIHISVYNEAEIIDVGNYSLYTDHYRDALKKIDIEIEKVNERIQNETNTTLKTSLKSKRASLIDKRSVLLEEAVLVEDLNKFY